MNFLQRLINGFRSKPRVQNVRIDTDENDWKSFQKIADALNRLQGPKSAVLELEIIGLNRIHPTVVLSLHELLSRRPASVKLRVRILTNLADGSLIFPLVADELYLRQGVWFQWEQVEQLEKKLPMDDDDEEGEGWNPEVSKLRVNTVKEPPALTDYRAMSVILGNYLPLSEFKDKRVPLEETLSEFGLLPGSSHDTELSKLFAR